MWLKNVFLIDENCMRFIKTSLLMNVTSKHVAIKRDWCWNIDYGKQTLIIVISSSIVMRSAGSSWLDWLHISAPVAKYLRSCASYFWKQSIRIVVYSLHFSTAKRLETRNLANGSPRRNKNSICWQEKNVWNFSKVPAL